MPIDDTAEISEQRKYARLETAMRMKYHVAGAGTKPVEAHCLNISLGGVCFLAREKLRKRTPMEVNVYFSTEEKEPITVRGTVVWQGRDGGKGKKGFPTGIFFETMEKAIQKRFVDFVFDNLYKMVGLPDWPRISQLPT